MNTPKCVRMNSGCGYAQHCVFLNECDGKCYAMGSNEWGQKGVTTATTTGDEHFEYVFTQVSIPTHGALVNCGGIVDVSCGADFSVFLGKCGRVWTCGNNRKGQLGHSPDSAQVTTPLLVSYFLRTRTHSTNNSIRNKEKVAKKNKDNNKEESKNQDDGTSGCLIIVIVGIYAGSTFTAYIDSDEKLWLTGTHFVRRHVDKKYEACVVKQVRLTESAEKEVKPYWMQSLSNQGVECKQVVCGAEYCCVLDSKGKCYVFGNGSFGSMGNGTMEYFNSSPRLVNFDIDLAMHRERDQCNKVPLLRKRKRKTTRKEQVRIDRLHSGNHHVCAVSRKKGTKRCDYYLWGYDSYHQISGVCECGQCPRLENEFGEMCICFPHRLCFQRELLIMDVYPGVDRTMLIVAE